MEDERDQEVGREQGQLKQRRREDKRKGCTWVYLGVQYMYGLNWSGNFNTKSQS
jgi:hypothetical protein